MAIVKTALVLVAILAIGHSALSDLNLTRTVDSWDSFRENNIQDLSSIKLHLSNDIAQTYQLGTAPLNSSAPLTSGTITISPSSGTPTYYLPFPQPQSQSSPTIVSLSSFSALVGDSLSFSIRTIKSNRTGFAFQVSTFLDNKWAHMRLTFLSATTRDMEIGRASYDMKKNDVQGYVTYQLQQNWAHPQTLKAVVFLSALSAQSKSSAVGYQLTHQYMQNSLLVIRFQAAQNTTIETLSLDLLFFDPLNQLLRFQQAQLTQTFLSAPISIPLPQARPAEERIFMAGLSDLVVESNSQVRMISGQNSTSFVIGPTDTGCHFNYFSLTYILVAYNPCSFCKEEYVIYNGSCFDSCPRGTVKRGLICQAITCKDGTYLSDDNTCRTCPKRSNIAACHNGCKEDEYLSGQDCYPMCQPSLFLKYSKGRCVCMGSYYNISGVCKQCEEGTFYQSSSGSCVTICSATQQYSLLLHSCECRVGLFRIGPNCSTCPETHTYSASSKSCISKCRTDEYYSLGQCLCREGTVRAANQSCILCPPGTVFNQTTQLCRSVCSQNETYLGSACLCKKDYYKIGETCGQCPPNLYYNPQLKICRQQCTNHSVYDSALDQCQCQSTFNMAVGLCTCPQQSFYSLVIDRCVCNEGFRMTPSTPFSCVSICQTNEVYSKGQCVCQPGTYRIGDKCSFCPAGTIYDSSLGVCHPPCSSNQTFSLSLNKCICKTGYYLIEGACSQCLTSETYDISSTKCLSKCPFKFQVYNESSSSCECLPSYFLINGQCEPCPPGQFYYVMNDGTRKCFYNCRSNELFNATSLRCMCQQGFYNISGKCDQCPSNMQFNINVSRCECLKGYGLKGGACVNCGPCSTVNPASGVCQCLPNFFLINGVCSTCPVSTVYDPKTEACLISCPPNSTYNISTSSCQCLSGYYMSTNQQCLEQCPQGQRLVSNQCSCVNSSQVLYKGECLDPLSCPPHSYFHVSSYCCLCDQGYRLNSGSCVYFSCGDNSYDYNGICVCKKGYFMVGGRCQQCQQNQVYNGIECACLKGYTRNRQNLCVVLAIPICKTNEVYNYTLKQCVCIQGYQYFMGSCQTTPKCPPYSDWNGIACECRSGYLMDNGLCKEVNNPLPSCPTNSYFNGVACNCQSGYYPIQPGYCGLCSPNYYWNGQQCTQQKQCQVGYVVSPFDGGCISVGQLCGEGAQWNGVTCCCLPGYNNIGNVCVRCPQGTYFDGKSCSPSAQPCPSNEVNLNGQCQCVQGFHRIGGVCTQCPSFTIWNGNYCSCPSSNPASWCLGIPFSIQTNSGCQCQAGYLKLNGMCVSS